MNDEKCYATVFFSLTQTNTPITQLHMLFVQYKALA